ncbi:MAG: hypothetical protein ACUVTD_09425 [Nitrososphaerales archaeon]
MNKVRTIYRRLINLSDEEEKFRTVYKIICLISSLIMITILAYGLVTAATRGINVVGETLVNTEFPPMNFPFYAKPVTWLVASVIVFWFSFLELNKKTISKIPKFARQLSMLIAFFIGAMALYEVFFNFTLWGSLMATSEILGELNPDLLVNPFPNPEKPWNLVYATKIFLLITIVAFYTFYFLTRMDSKS